MKSFWIRVKPFSRWLILGAVLFFLAKTLKDHWQEIAAIELNAASYACLAIALGVTLLAHICAGWVWSWILQALNQPVTGVWGVQVYLKTNIAKYLPGNLWHFYGRISSATKAGVPVEAATLSVVLEPLLMVAAALAIALVSLPQIQVVGVAAHGWQEVLAITCLILVLISLHPRFLNPVVARLTKLKQKATAPQTLQIQRYPWRSLFGEIAFLGLRGIGFVLTFLAISSVSLSQFPTIISAFAFAWLLGFVTPGLPGGIGVFEAVAIALLQQSFSSGDLLSAVALYRLVNTLAEAIGAGLVVLDDRI